MTHVFNRQHLGMWVAPIMFLSTFLGLKFSYLWFLAGFSGILAELSSSPWLLYNYLPYLAPP